MARSTKWIKDVSPDQPAADVARLALCARLDAVVYFLPKAAMEADEDIEYVHQLRVATRRSMAAILTFQSLLPVRRTDKLRKMLRRLRKAAGEARDLDVLYERLDKQARRTHIPGMKKVLTKVSRRRDAAQRPLLKIHQKWQRPDNEVPKHFNWSNLGPETPFLSLLPEDPRICETAEQLFGTWSIEANTQEATEELARMADDESNQLNASAEEFRLWWTQERADSIRQCLSPYT